MMSKRFSFLLLGILFSLFSYADCSFDYPKCYYDTGEGFEAATLVKTLHGYTEIADLNVGDFVLSYDFDRSCSVESPVVAVHHRTMPRYIKFNIDDDGNETLITGIDQSFYLPKYDNWFLAYNMEIESSYREFFFKNAWEIINEIDLYVIEVEQHNFFVTEMDLLVHNAAVAAAVDCAMRLIPIYSIIGTTYSFSKVACYPEVAFQKYPAKKEDSISLPERVYYKLRKKELLDAYKDLKSTQDLLSAIKGECGLLMKSLSGETGLTSHLYKDPTISIENELDLDAEQKLNLRSYRAKNLFLIEEKIIALQYSLFFHCCHLEADRIALLDDCAELADIIQRSIYWSNSLRSDLPIDAALYWHKALAEYIDIVQEVEDSCNTIICAHALYKKLDQKGITSKTILSLKYLEQLKTASEADLKNIASLKKNLLQRQRETDNFFHSSRLKLPNHKNSLEKNKNNRRNKRRAKAQALEQSYAMPKPPNPDDDPDKNKYPNGRYGGTPYHNKNSKGVRVPSENRKGMKSPPPIDGQAALDNSIKLEGDSCRRVAREGNNIVVLDITFDGLYHGHIRSLEEIINGGDATQAIRNALQDAEIINHRGRFL